MGKKAKAVMESGGLVSDEIVIGIIKDNIGTPECSRGYVPHGVSFMTSCVRMCSASAHQCSTYQGLDWVRDAGVSGVTKPGRIGYVDP